MSSNSMIKYLALGIGAYWLYTQAKAGTYLDPSVGMQKCQYPNGDTIDVPSGNSCPFDITKGGQSVPCYPYGFTGPLPPGSVTCGGLVCYDKSYLGPIPDDADYCGN